MPLRGEHTKKIALPIRARITSPNLNRFITRLSFSVKIANHQKIIKINYITNMILAYKKTALSHFRQNQA